MANSEDLGGRGFLRNPDMAGGMVGATSANPSSSSATPSAHSFFDRVLKPTRLSAISFIASSLLLSLNSAGHAQQQDSTPQEMINKARELRALMQSDPHRPIYHFVAPEGHAMPFDPNGAIYWKGRYHLGYVYQKPTEIEHLHGGKRQFVWGHAVSTDLLHWTTYPDMLPAQNGHPDENIYSGGMFVSREGVPHAIYFSPEGNRLASATDDDLKVWKRLGDDPVLKRVDRKERDKAKYSVFDAEAWYDTKSDSYYQTTGGHKPGLFKSKDMYRWKYLGNAIGGPDPMRFPFEDASCPKFFSLGDKFMHLSISHALGVHYYIGTFANDKFVPERHARMNWPGGTFFAPDHLQDGKGRNIIWGWIVQPRSPALQAEFGWSATLRGGAPLRDYGWSGVMSLPRVVSLSDKGALQIKPAEELQAIRLNEMREQNIVLQPNTETTLQARGKSIELKLDMAGGARSAFGVKVFASPDGREETVIRYEPELGQLVVDFARSSVVGPVSLPFFLHNPKKWIPDFDPEIYNYSTDFSRQYSETVSEQRAPLKLENGETLQLNIFLDRSIIEVFANGRQVMTQVVYPELASSTGVKFFSGNEAVTVKNIQSWTIAETNQY